MQVCFPVCEDEGSARGGRIWLDEALRNDGVDRGAPQSPEPTSHQQGLGSGVGLRPHMMGTDLLDSMILTGPFQLGIFHDSWQET